jgi:hypothetical protein
MISGKTGARRRRGIRKEYLLLQDLHVLLSNEVAECLLGQERILLPTVCMTAVRSEHGRLEPFILPIQGSITFLLALSFAKTKARVHAGGHVWVGRSLEAIAQLHEFVASPYALS